MDRLSLHSRNAPKPIPHPTVCCVYPCSNDKLRLLNFPPNLLPAFRIAIQTSWNRGIQSEGINGNKTCYEVKLRGNPWSLIKNGAVAVESCRLTMGIMRFMLAHGWSLDLSTHLLFNYGQDSWFFRKTTQETHVVMCSISFSARDKIKVIDGSSEVTQAVRSTIMNHWYRGLQQQRVHCEAEEFKLSGLPWYSQRDKAHATALMMYMLDALRSAGWTLYASVGTATGGGRGGGEMDDWILKKSKA